MFLKAVTYAHQGCIYLIKDTVKNSIIDMYYYILQFKIFKCFMFNIL